jgi:hypothetical protein
MTVRGALYCRDGSAYPLVYALGRRESPAGVAPDWAGVMKRCGLCCWIALRPITFGTHWERAIGDNAPIRAGTAAVGRRPGAPPRSASRVAVDQPGGEGFLERGCSWPSSASPACATDPPHPTSSSRKHSGQRTLEASCAGRCPARSAGATRYRKL